MTNSIAIVLALVIAGAMLIDAYSYGADHMIFLGKKLFELIEWIAFWR
ncbi:hypothetical protein DSM14862_01795 [Sulfitobacter indolifex]|jgi:hypothetical protein|uniref:Glyceraldehyde-3-phosphate dehydrogenase n=1 Tax=Sulfitobacter indolifex HEL-45 TaxID=391624 RepID=A0ABP2D7I7_9RHOB|nr:hypothetical protein [Sulfitobacter indolifex]EDQ04153.1 hypothetical protein OIHEL45_14529 [Sulfitobacter indolifex HEL-45]UOA19008.1 hypothetical protein DSM14862_01795 [Sulfitobacter indolifex]